jgi:hypothetical protein
VKKVWRCFSLAALVAAALVAAGCPAPGSAPAAEPAHVWTRYNTSGVFPSARMLHAMDWAGGSKAILFGGSVSGGDSDETWEYDASTRVWTQYNTAGTRPTARYDHALAYAGGSKMILFGGEGFRSDTWEYDVVSHTWTEYVYTGIGTKPPGRYEHAMAWAGGSKLILFGGSGSGDTLNDTWEYDVSTHVWTEIAVAGSKPAARRVHALAYAGDAKVILFGGYVYGSEQVDDTWEYDVAAHTWTQVNMTGSKPEPRQEHALAWVGGRKLVLYGGRNGTFVPVDPDWEYDAATHVWTQFNIAGTTPYQRREHTLAYAGDGRVILFGGMANNGYGQLYDETWECLVVE